jgi:hypothetical protein
MSIPYGYLFGLNLPHVYPRLSKILARKFQELAYDNAPYGKLSE